MMLAIWMASSAMGYVCVCVVAVSIWGVSWVFSMSSLAGRYGVHLGGELLHEVDVVSVSDSRCENFSLEREPQQVEVAEQVQRLVAHELVRVAQRLFLVVDLVHADDDGVVQRAAAGQALALEPLYFVVEAERARARDFAEVVLRVQPKDEGLLLDQRVLEINRGLQLQEVGGFH